ncbi:integrase arm-type DNA-binding domain-containing protein [Chelativorans sp. ZYF759]|uniref:tyrosine-type recombinase/integrase n=1 Tax=Chelativorans sp. ZYF759 TaxID=2692213 RepID=UPI00145F2ACA|nr:site-specific integrase [Chelativorans sp. ZYF759]NMG40376.1 integrase arm-type DNA-binding domain-containing protein [Chelativorans sp. ZYF759]
MPKTLSAKEVEALDSDGMHRVDVGLYLQIRDEGKTRSWLLRYRYRGKPKWMGLGPARLITVTEAKRKALAGQRLLLDGIDPAKARREERRANALTFAECAERYIKAHKAGWRNDKHIAQWQSTLDTYAGPIIGKLLVDEVDTDHILKVLEPIWTTKTETATRVRGRIERVLDWAGASGMREGENPARWKGNLIHHLPAAAKVQKSGNHAMVAYADVPAVMRDLAKMDSASARALRFTILTAARTGEVLGATWDEVDLKAKVWTVPAERMKAGKAHRVTLSDAAVAVLNEMPIVGARAHNARIFPLSNMAMLQCVRGLRDGATVHGFRASFSTWANETTEHPREIVEASLAHTVGDAVERAYRRGDYLAKRRALMDDWAAYLAKVRSAG